MTSKRCIVATMSCLSLFRLNFIFFYVNYRDSLQLVLCGITFRTVNCTEEYSWRGTGAKHIDLTDLLL